MIFSSKQIQELLDIISLYHTVYIGSSIDSQILLPEDISLLSQHGIDLDDITTEFTPFEEAYYFGILSEAIGHQNSTKLKYSNFKDFLMSGKFIPLTSQEESILNYIKKQSYNYIKGLEGKVIKDVQQSISSQEYRVIIKEELERGVQERKSVKNIISEIGHKSGQWQKDLGRIVETEMHTAFEQGRAASIQKKYGDDALVYKDVKPGACRWCINLFLTDGLGSTPKIFKLSTLKENGTNIGRKPQEWLPVIGAVHPFCRCTMYPYNSDYQWDQNTKSFSKLKEGKSIERKSKVKVQIGNQTFLV